VIRLDHDFFFIALDGTGGTLRHFILEIVEIYCSVSIKVRLHVRSIWKAPRGEIVCFRIINLKLRR
jgi:hypothetical protein